MIYWGELFETLLGRGEGFFPPAGILARRQIARTVAGAGDDEERRLDAGCALSRQNPLFIPYAYRLDTEFVTIEQAGRTFAIPRPLPMVNYVLLVSGYFRWIDRKYTLPGFCEVEPGDVVVDCGAYIGGFGLSKADVAREVHLFEPDPANFAILSKNAKEQLNCRLHQRGLFSMSGALAFNRSASSVEHSFLTPDDGEALEAIEVEVSRLDDFARVQRIAQIDFLKIEAEGVEIEVLDGAGDLPLRKIAIDISPERDGKSPRFHFERALVTRGFDIRVRRNMLFARRRD